MATWRELISRAMLKSGDSWQWTVETTLTEAELDAEFDSSFGSVEGKPFLLWTSRYVYFPLQYDGSEYVGYAPRDPCNQPLEHQ